MPEQILCDPKKLNGLPAERALATNRELVSDTLRRTLRRWLKFEQSLYIRQTRPVYLERIGEKALPPFTNWSGRFNVAPQRGNKKEDHSLLYQIETYNRSFTATIARNYTTSQERRQTRGRKRKIEGLVLRLRSLEASTITFMTTSTSAKSRSSRNDTDNPS